MALVKSNIPYAVKIDNFPVQENILTYDGGNLSPIWKFFDADKIYISGGTTSEINAGTYLTEFLPFRKFVFPNGTKKIYRAPWTINKAENIITLSETSGEVKIKKTRQFTISRLGDGEISVTSSDPDIAAVSLSGNVVTITGVDVGDVLITVNVAEGKNYLATSTVYACQSRKTKIPIPVVSATSKTFNGSWQSPTVTNAPNTALVTLTGTFSAYNYSDTPYSFTYSIKDTHACEWDNGSISPLTYSWKINKAIFALPVQIGTLTYTGRNISPTWNFGSTNLIAITNGSAVEAGTHTATFSLRDTFNCAWADGSTSDKSATFTIAKIKITTPSLTKESYSFGEDLTFKNLDSNYVNWEWETDGNVGKNSIKLSLKYPDTTCWSNGSSKDISLSFSVTRAPLPDVASDYSVAVINDAQNSDYQPCTRTMDSVRLASGTLRAWVSVLIPYFRKVTFTCLAYYDVFTGAPTSDIDTKHKYTYTPTDYRDSDVPGRKEVVFPFHGDISYPVEIGARIEEISDNYNSKAITVCIINGVR